MIEWWHVALFLYVCLMLTIPVLVYRIDNKKEDMSAIHTPALNPKLKYIKNCRCPHKCIHYRKHIGEIGDDGNE